MATHVFNEGVDLDDEIPTSAKSKSGLGTIYDQFRAELSKPSNVQKEVILKVPSRDGIKVKFSTDLSLEQLTRWRTRAKKNKKNEDIDLVLFNEMLIVSQCKGIIFNDEEVFDEDDDPITFNTRGFQDSLNALDIYGAVKSLYDRDADILRTGDEILEAAGYGDADLEDGDPLVQQIG